MTANNGSGIAAVGILEALMFNTAQMYKKGLNVEYSTSALLRQYLVGCAGLL